MSEAWGIDAAWDAAKTDPKVTASDFDRLARGDGVWVVWSRDMSATVNSIHATELEALREAVSGGFGERVVFVRFGEQINDVEGIKLR